MTLALPSIPYNRNIGGMNRVSGPPNVRDFEWEDAGNIDIDTDGSVRSRDGMVQVADVVAIKNELASWWNLDEVAGTRFDRAFQRNNLTDNNTVIGVPGFEGNAASFVKANNETLSIPFSQMSKLDGSAGSFSISIWFKASLPGFFLWCRDLGAASGYDLALSGGSLEFFTFFPTAPATLSITSATSGLEDGAWHNVVIVKDQPNDLLRMYIDGAEDGNSPTAPVADISWPAFTAGFFILGGTEVAVAPVGNYDGQLDQVQFWTKVLSGSEASTIWNSGAIGGTDAQSDNGLSKSWKELHQFKPRDGLFETVGVCAGLLQRYESDTDLFQPIELPTNVPGFLSDTLRVSFGQLFDWLFFGNGLDENMRYEGKLALFTQGLDDAGSVVVTGLTLVGGGSVEADFDYAYKVIPIRQIAGARTITGKASDTASAQITIPAGSDDTIEIATFPTASDPGQTHWGLYRVQMASGPPTPDPQLQPDSAFEFIADVALGTVDFQDAISQVGAAQTGENLGLHSNNIKTPPCQFRAVTNLDGADIMLQSGNPLVPDTLYPSSTVAGVGPDTSRSNFQQIVGRDDGDPVSALAAIYDHLIIFKEDRAFIFSPTFDDTEFPYRFAQSHAQLGCLSHWSVANIEGKLHWYCDQGVYQMYGIFGLGDVRVKKLSRRIDKLMKNIDGPRRQDVLAAYLRRPGPHHYRLACTQIGQTTNRLMLPYDVEHLSPDPKTNERVGAWSSQWTSPNIDFEALGLIESSSDFLDELWVGSSDGKVYKMDSGTNDDGVAIATFFHSAHYDAKRGSTTKRWRDLILDGQTVGGSLNIAWYLDWAARFGGTKAVQLAETSQTAGSAWGTSEYGLADYGGPGIASKPLIGARMRFANATGHHLQLRFTSSILDMSWVLHAWELAAVPRRSRRMARV